MDTNIRVASDTMLWSDVVYDLEVYSYTELNRKSHMYNVNRILLLLSTQHLCTVGHQLCRGITGSLVIILLWHDYCIAVVVRLLDTGSYTNISIIGLHDGKEYFCNFCAISTAAIKFNFEILQQQ